MSELWSHWFHLLMIGCNFNHKICFSGGPWSILSPSLSPGIMNAGNYETSLGIASKTWRYLSQRGVSNFRNLVEEMGIIVNPRQLVLHKRAKNMIMFWKYQMRNALAKIFTLDPVVHGDAPGLSVSILPDHGLRYGLLFVPIWTFHSPTRPKGVQGDFGKMFRYDK